MLTNGREEYQMTSGDWEGGREGGGDRAESDPVLFEGFILAVFSLSISVKGSLRGLGEDHPTLLVNKSLMSAFSSIYTLGADINNLSSVNNSTIQHMANWFTPVCHPQRLRLANHSDV